MIVNLPLFLLAVALLWLPRRWMRLGAIRLGRKRIHRERDTWRQSEVDPTRIGWDEFAKGRNYHDLFRAGVGGLALLGGLGLPSVMAVPAGWEHGRLKLLGIQIAILAVGVLIQTVRRERGRVKCYPPVFFLAGLSVGLCGPAPAAFAFLLVWSLGRMIGNAQLFLILYAILLPAFGIMLGGDRVRWMAAAALCALPALISLLSGRPLLVLERRRVPASARST